MELSTDNLPAWSANEAKLRFGALLDRLVGEGPQRIMRNGREVAILVRPKDWRPAQSAFVSLCAPGFEVALSDAAVDTLFALDLAPGAPARLEADHEGLEGA